MDPLLLIKDAMLAAKSRGLDHAVAYRVMYSVLADHLQRDPNLQDEAMLIESLTVRLASNMAIKTHEARRLLCQQ